MKASLIAVSLLLGSLLLVTTVVGTARAATSSCFMDPGVQGASPEPVAPVTDQEIIDQMIELHARSIGVTSVGLQFAQDADVRRMALRVAEGQAGELQLLRYWRSIWFPDAPPGPTALSTSTPCTAGEFTDRSFLAAMIALHQQAIALAQTALAQSQRVDLVNIADAAITARTVELNMMLGWIAGSTPSPSATPTE